MNSTIKHSPDLDQHVLDVLACLLEVEKVGTARCIPWPPTVSLISLLVRHGLVGMYEMGLRQGELWKVVPPDLKERVEFQLAAQWTTNMQLAALQDHVGDLLTAGGVRHFILKGLPLSERLYGNAMIRATSDIDLLLDPRDLGMGERLLCQNGFAMVGKHKHFHVSFHHPRMRGLVECHRDLTDFRFRFPIAAIFDRAHMENVSGRMLLVMDPVDEILYLCTQLAVNYFQYRFQYLVDVTRWIQNWGTHVNWPVVMERAGEIGLRLVMSASIGHAECLLGGAWSQREGFRGLAGGFEKGFRWRLIRWLADPDRPFDARVHRRRIYRRILALTVYGSGGKTRAQT